MLVCPKCQKALIKADKEYYCANNHHFDIAKEGYTNLELKPSKHSGDDKMMVNARRDFLALGYYDQLKTFLIKAIRAIHPAVIVDAGCGEGYYTSGFNAETVYGFDMSKIALRYASKQDKQHNYFLSSIYHLPLSDNCCDVVMNIFAPCAHDEFKRIMKDKAILIKVDPGSEHLYELKQLLYDHVYLNNDKTLDDYHLCHQQNIKYQVTMNNEELLKLFKMTPYVYKTSDTGLAKINAVDQLTVTLDFVVSFYKK